KTRLCELVDGVLVEKTTGFTESYIASFLLTVVFEFVRSRNLGLVTGMDGCIRPFPGQVRIPDVAYVSWNRIPGRSFPKKPIPDLVPDLAVEVLSISNTRGEMTRKLQDYFDAGCRVVWYVDPVTETIHVHRALNSVVVLGRKDVIDGGDLLPGLSIKLEDIFSEPAP
ncbi:MAG TPA: Uma2 family endonuclease, partial [Isosphaeraceae bacterium]|nr:Uma2 family endonuclease [Isosphaeraceae bacterium]